MNKSRGSISRSEVLERVSNDTERLQEGAKRLEEHASDISVIRETIEKLDFSGTDEGAREVMDSIESAENDVTGHFDEVDAELEQVQNESQEHETEFDERREGLERDLGEISDAKALFHTDIPSDRFSEANEAYLKDIRLFEEQTEQIREDREKSVDLQKILEDIVRSGR